jgi:signal transduction histidine kinase/ligand-binding sensor domain-containing protein
MIRPVPFCFGLLLFGVNPANALDPKRLISQYAHTAWRIEDGVFSGAPHAITQTTDGYLWIGTEAGLVRFDGVRFFTWTTPDGKPLYSPSIYSLLGARDGSLWIGDGISLARVKDGEVFNYREPLGRINSIVEDQAGTIWVARSGVRVMDANGPVCRVAGHAVRCYGEADGIPFLTGGPLMRDILGHFWIVGPRGPCDWVPGSSCTYFPKEPGQARGAVVRALASGRDGSLWAGTEQAIPSSGLQQLIQGVWKPYSLPGMGPATSDVSALFIDDENTLWVGTMSQGIYHIHDGKTDHFDTADGLSSDSVERFYQDREGNLWVTTSRGIDRFRNLRVASFSVRQGLSADRAGSVLASRDGTLWIGNHGALNFLRQGKMSAIRARVGLPGQNVTSLFEDYENRLWVGIDDGLTVYERGRFHSVTRPDGSPLGIVVALTEDVEHDIWAEVALKRAPLIRIRDLRFREEIVSPRAFALAADPRGGIWLGSVNEGLVRYSNGQLETIPPKVPEVRSLLVDPDGSLWAATRGGLVRWKEGKLKILDSTRGLPCDSIAAVVRDNQQALWLYAKCGAIAIADAELQSWWEHPNTTVKLLLFDVFDGVQPALMSFRPGTSKSADGRLWFVNDSVVQVIDPSHLEGNGTPPPVHIERITADRRVYWDNSLGNESSNLRLPSLVRDLEIDYTALSLVVPEKIRFKYKLEGRDRDWQDVGNRRQAFYNDLPPRDYRFRVMASNDSGVWNEAGASFDFSIKPAYYQTTWFQASCAAAVLGLLGGLYRYRLHRIAQQFNARLDERVNERTRIARELHDTLLQSFQALMFHFQAVNRLLPSGKGKEALEKVLDRADQAIVEGRDAIQNIRSSTTATNELSHAMTALGEELAGANDGEKGSATFHVSVEGPPRELRPILRDDIYRIAREALRNAFRHAQASQIEAEITYGERLLRLRIRDNGKGIDPKHLHAGRDGHWGLPGMRERAQQIGAKFEMWSEVGAGTEVEVSIPGSIVYEKARGRSGLRLFRKKKEGSDER